MFKGLESEIRLSEQVPSSFLREITMIKLLFLVLVAATYLAKGGDLEDQTTLQKSTSQIVFYRYFTPTELASAATFIHYHHSLTPRLLTFLSAPKSQYRLMIVPLIQPAVTTAHANLVIKMNVGLETTFGAADSDPSFVISDGSRFIGMLTLDKNNYKNCAPCLGAEGASGPTTTRRSDACLPKPSESYYPGRFEIQLSLSDRWGTCFVPLDGGFSREMIYQNKLNPRKGLFLEIYGDDAGEKEGIKYIEITILKGI